MTIVRWSALKLLDIYLRTRYRLSFHNIIFDYSQIDEQLNRDQPVLFVPNHSTWWDGFLIYSLYRRLKLKNEFRLVMLESELEKFPFFRLCGAVGIIPKNRTYNSKVFLSLKNQNVCFFPQGKMTPLSLRPISFRTGINSLIQTLKPIQILTVAIHIEPFQFMKPTVLVKAGYLFQSETETCNHEALAQLLEKNLDDISDRWTAEIYAQGGS